MRAEDVNTKTEVTWKPENAKVPKVIQEIQALFPKESPLRQTLLLNVMGSIHKNGNEIQPIFDLFMNLKKEVQNEILKALSNSENPDDYPVFNEIKNRIQKLQFRVELDSLLANDDEAKKSIEDLMNQRLYSEELNLNTLFHAVQRTCPKIRDLISDSDQAYPILKQTKDQNSIEQLRQELNQLLDPILAKEVKHLLDQSRFHKEDEFKKDFEKIAKTYPQILSRLAISRNPEKYPRLLNMTAGLKTYADYCLYPLIIAKRLLAKRKIGDLPDQFRCAVTQSLWHEEIKNRYEQLKIEVNAEFEKGNESNQDWIEVAAEYATYEFNQVKHFRSDCDYYLQPLTNATEILEEAAIDPAIKMDLISKIAELINSQKNKIEEAIPRINAELNESRQANTAVLSEAREVATSFREMVLAVCTPFENRNKTAELRTCIYELLSNNLERLASINNDIQEGSLLHEIKIQAPELDTQIKDYYYRPLIEAINLIEQGPDENLKIEQYTIDSLRAKISKLLEGHNENLDTLHQKKGRGLYYLKLIKMMFNIEVKQKNMGETYAMLMMDLYNLLHINNPSLLTKIIEFTWNKFSQSELALTNLFNEIIQHYPQLLFYLAKNEDGSENPTLYTAKTELCGWAIRSEFFKSSTLITHSLPPKDCFIAPLNIAIGEIQKLPVEAGLMDELNNLLKRLDLELTEELNKGQNADPEKIEGVKKIVLEHHQMIRILCDSKSDTRAKKIATETCLENCSRIPLIKTAFEAIFKIMVLIAVKAANWLGFTPSEKFMDQNGLNKPLSPSYSRAGFFVSRAVEKRVLAIAQVIQEGIRLQQ